MRELEYVVSGTSFMRLANPGSSGDPDVYHMINDLFGKFVHNHKSHTYSILYNAYQEAPYVTN